MNEIKIDTGIPIPKPRGREYSKELRETLDCMRVGDSFFIETRSRRMNAIGQARKLGVKVVSAKEGNGWRMWRSL